MAHIIMFSLILPLLSLLTVVPGTFQLEVHHQTHSNGLKSLNFSVYLHTPILKGGAAGPGPTSRHRRIAAALSNNNPLGSSSHDDSHVSAFSDPITETPDPNSKVIGYTEGSMVLSSITAGRSTDVLRTVLKIKGYEGELFNVGTGYYQDPPEHAVIGGTGDFRFVQGYLITSAVDHTIPMPLCYKFDFYLFWPPYVAAIPH